MILLNTEFAFPDGQPLHSKPRNTLDMVMRKPVESFENLRKWKCVLGKCNNNCPKAQFHPFKQSTNEVPADNTVRFQHYEKFTKYFQHRIFELHSKKCDLSELKNKRGKDSDTIRADVITKKYWHFLKRQLLASAGEVSVSSCSCTDIVEARGDWNKKVWCF